MDERVLKASNKIFGIVINMDAFSYNRTSYGRQKFEVAAGDQITLVLNQCGTEVDNDFYSTLTANTILILLREDEIWSPESPRIDEPGTSTLATAAERDNPRNELMKLVERLEKKKPQRNASQTATLHCGWMNYRFSQGKYCQVRSSKNDTTGGVLSLKFPVDADYATVLGKVQDKFFPFGRNQKGRINQFDVMLGTSKQKIIQVESFKVEDFCKQFTTGGRARIYLLTKRKFTDFASLSTSEESDDLEVPPPWKRSRSSRTLDDWSQPGTSTVTQIVSTPQTAQMAQTASTTLSPQWPENGLATFHHVEAGTPTVTMKVPNDKCVICCDRPKCSFFIPCGHKCCTVCGVQLENSTHSCPFCRMEITGLGTIRD